MAVPKLRKYWSTETHEMITTNPSLLSDRFIEPAFILADFRKYFNEEAWLSGASLCEVKTPTFYMFNL